MRGKKAQNLLYRFLIDVANLESIINNAAASGGLDILWPGRSFRRRYQY